MLTADELPAAVSVRGFANPVIQAWSRGSEALYGYPAAEAIGHVAHELLASIFPIPLAEIEEIVRVEGEWLGTLSQQRRDGAWIVVLAAWRLQRDSQGLPESISQVSLPLALEQEAGAARELVLQGTVARLELRGVGQTAELKERDATVASMRRTAVGQTADLKERDATVASMKLTAVGQTAELKERDATVAGLELVGVGQTAELKERDATVAGLELVGVGQTAELKERDATVAGLELLGAGQVAELIARDATLAGMVRRDVRRVAALEAAVQELDAFAYSVSHDLRTPLRAIHGYAQALAEDNAEILPAAAHADLDRIQKAATRMGSLIDDLLRLSRITRGSLDRRPVDLAELARDIAGRMVASSVARSDVQWQIDEHAWATADHGLLEIVLENLLGNASKFCANHEGAVISFSSAESAEGRIFSVRDDGVGFDMAHAGNLFTPFHRLHSSRDFEGSGIGLAIVQRIVRRHGGRAWAEATPGQGATIHFTLPEAIKDAA